MNRLSSECIRCLTEKYLSKIPAHLTEDQKVDYLQTILSIMANADKRHAAPVALHTIEDVLFEKFGIKQDFAPIRRHFNALMMERENDFIQRLENASDPLKLGIQLAMIGNYVDFGAIENVNAKSLVYLTDNCGEIVFDKCLMRTIARLYPHLTITAVVRGGEVSNDATREDAEQIRLSEVARVLDNGTRIAGTWLEGISEESKRAIDTADVLIAKGQANFETLRKCGLNIYYIFLCKCDMFARNFGVPRLTGMMVNDKEL